jgi:hypothetical protein
VYSWIWRHLPGPWPLKAFLALALVAIVVLLCFQFLFPWLEDTVPWLGDVTVEDGPATSGFVLPPLR